MLRRLFSFGLSVFLVTAFVLTVNTKIAHAYIDLGTGSFLLQMLLATGLASLFMIKVYWQRLTRRLSRLFSRSKTTEERFE